MTSKSKIITPKLSASIILILWTGLGHIEYYVFLQKLFGALIFASFVVENSVDYGSMWFSTFFCFLEYEF